MAGPDITKGAWFGLVGPNSLAAFTAMYQATVNSDGSLNVTPISGGLFAQAVLARTTLPAAKADGTQTQAIADPYGRQIVLPITSRDLASDQNTTISASTAETTIVTQEASVVNDLIALFISNTSSTSTRIDFRDTTAGSVRFSLQSIGGGGPIGFVIPVPLKQTLVNTNWTAQGATSVTDLRILALFARNRLA